MTAYEAKEKMNQARAKKSVSRIFHVIEKAVKNGEGGIQLSITYDRARQSEKALTEEEFKVLETEYKYKLQAVYDDSGDYHKSDKKIGYWVLWE